ncbi:MAG: hypothetical protein ACXW3P_09360, partial [Rhodospirillales bacterium]
ERASVRCLKGTAQAEVLNIVVERLLLDVKSASIEHTHRRDAEASHVCIDLFLSFVQLKRTEVRSRNALLALASNEPAQESVVQQRLIKIAVISELVLVRIEERQHQEEQRLPSEFENLLVLGNLERLYRRFVGGGG